MKTLVFHFDRMADKTEVVDGYDEDIVGRIDEYT
jgi:hypothetical protein